MILDFPLPPSLPPSPGPNRQWLSPGVSQLVGNDIMALLEELNEAIDSADKSPTQVRVQIRKLAVCMHMIYANGGQYANNVQIICKWCTNSVQKLLWECISMQEA